MPNSLISELRRLIDEDIDDICNQYSEMYRLTCDVLSYDVEQSEVDPSEFTVFYTFLIDGNETPASNSYKLEDDEWLVKDLTPEDLNNMYHMYHVKSIKSATNIFAADEDDPFAESNFDENTDGEEDTEDLEEDLDDAEDRIDNLEESLENFKEDDIDIETDNNIDDHYIAECEKCHGVFITAVQISTQEINKISGVCPLCDEECDQYLHWVIKRIDSDENM